MLFADADARRTIAAVRGRDLVWRQGCWEGEPPSARAGRLGARKGRVEVSWTQRGMKRQSALRAHREGIPTPLVCRGWWWGLSRVVVLTSTGKLPG